MSSWREPYDVTIEVENKKCKVIETLSSYGLKHIKVVDVRGVTKGVIKHLILISPSQLNQLPVDFIGETKTGLRHLWFESEGCIVCNTILAHGAFLISGKSIDSSNILYSFMVPDFDTYQKIINELEEMGYRVNIKKIGRFKHKKTILTEKQERLLWLAFKSGFFDYPRRIEARELAAKLGVKSSTFSEICRRALKRLVENYFGSEIP
ncbi:MAG: helix-turn-helix domain-containing protein [Candidatus Bathyarchaeia archaeon]